MCLSTRLTECCCGCSVRTGTLIVLWLDAALSTLMAMLYLMISHGIATGIDMFKKVAEYAYNGSKFFYHQSKSFGGDVDISDFEAVLRASREIDPIIEHYGRTIGSILFYWNMFLVVISVIGIVAVHRKQQFPLLIYGAIKVIETLVTVFVVFVACFRLKLPSFWLIAFPGAINIALKMYATMVVHSHWGEIIHHVLNKDTSIVSISQEDVEYAKKENFSNNKYDH